MLRNLLRIVSIATLLLARTGVAQILPASPPIADPADSRFTSVSEDWTSPALSTSHLRAVPTLYGSTVENATNTVELVRVQWRWGDPLDLYVMKPRGIKKPPVILYLYGYPEDTDIFKEESFQNAVTREGFAAVGLVSALTGHRYHDRPMREWFLSELQESLATTAHDVQMLLNYLATRDDLNMDRIGMFTQGSGASIGIMVSAVDPRVKALDALDPWGDWPSWMATSPFVPEDERAEYITPDFLKRVAGLEPLNWLPKIQAKKFRLQQAVFETDTPKDIKQKLRSAAPAGSAIALYQTSEEFGAAFSRGKNLEWLQHELRSLPVTAGQRDNHTDAEAAAPHAK